MDWPEGVLEGSKRFSISQCPNIVSISSISFYVLIVMFIFVDQIKLYLTSLPLQMQADL